MSAPAVSSRLLEVGDQMPDATLRDQDGKEVALHGLLGQGPIVLYFYPRDETPGCTAEACAFRDGYEDFTAAGAKVVGVSIDDVDSHRRFADHHRLPFTLLADPGGALHARFGVKKVFGFLAGRVTFVIDAGGVIRHVFDSKLQFTRHVREALEVVQKLRAQAPR